MTTIHHAVFSAISDVLERRPAFAYLFSTVSVGSGWLPWVDAGGKIVGLLAAIIGLVVGIYTLRIQKRNWEQGNKQ